jgi:hypothetical protein
MKISLALLVLMAFAATCVARAGCMDTDNQFWKSSMRATYDKLMGLMTCPLDADAVTGVQVDSVACNYFVAKALNVLYGVNDFAPPTNGGRWLTANGIVAYVRSHTDVWSKLGNADSQGALQDAAAGAAMGQPVIATLAGDPHGHVALILGGALHQSSTWGLEVPNSAAFSLNDVNRAYVFCRLSFAFSSPSQVELYWREKK